MTTLACRSSEAAPWRAGRAGLLALALLVGCASGSGPKDLGEEIRPDAPPEYDVLVAQQHASEGRAPEALAALERAVAKDDSSAYLQRVLADALARSSRLDDALVHARRAYELDPTNEDGRHLLVQLLRIKRDIPAIEALLLDENGAPKDTNAAYALHEVYIEAGRGEDALAMADWLLAHESDPLRAYIARANAYARLGKPELAEKALRDAIKLRPDDMRLYGALARSMRERGDHDGEIALYREILDKNPDDHSTLLALAEAQMADDDLEGAIGTLERVEQRYPGDERVSLRLGFLYYEARRFPEAAARFQRALAANPDESEIAFFLGVADRRIGNDDEALAAFASVPSDHEHYAEAQTQIASIYERRGQYDQAKAAVARAMAVEPSRALELYAATLQAKAGDLDGAVKYVQSLIDAEPDNDELHYNLGVIYGEAKENDRAIEAMRKALALNPDNASALNFIGYTWAERGENLDEAEKMIQRAIELRPEDGFIVDSLGWVYYMRARPLVQSGKMDAAQTWIERALAELERADELTGGDPVISEHLGDTYLLRGERKRALEMFEESVQQGPRDDEQPHLHEKLESLRRELQ
ncbi:MAG TPA: tetratricopeptide repeat protein [Myxococcota bacterium]|nr:tetratricopeptide repeat protein [Myxococcota bacterium]